MSSVLAYNNKILTLNNKALQHQALVTFKMGVLRPDADLIQTWSDDYYVHADKEVTIPAYSTSATTLVAAAAQTKTATLTNADYRYYVLERFLTIPEYSITTKGKGREEYTYSSILYEIVNIPANTFKALVSDTYYTSRNVGVFTVGNHTRELYWSSGTALALYTATSYGVAQVVTAPAISSGSAASPTLTITAPSCTIRGHTTYFTTTYYSALTDIRCQWKAELYRIPLSTAGNYGLDDWGLSSQSFHIIECANTLTHNLT